MYLNDVEELRENVLKALKAFGVKPKRFDNKCKRDINKKSNESIIFNVPLEKLNSTEVCLDCGAYVSVPTVVVQFCDRILADVKVEGIFRKNGSQARQHDIKVFLEKGGSISNSHHVIDVAVLLKEFLRHLPTPLIPTIYHDDFLKCLTLKENSLKVRLLLCFVLPPVHLNLFAYIMQFFSQVTSQSTYNKMDAYNIASIVTPNIMPIVCRNSNIVARTNNCNLIIQQFIDNSNQIGILPEGVMSVQHTPITLSTPNDDHIDARSHKRRRRSASLTRMFNGIKRMVAKHAEDNNTSTSNDIQQPTTPVPSLTLTSPSGQKRKCQDPSVALGFSSKKRFDDTERYHQQGQAPQGVKKKFFSSHSATNLKKSTTSLKEKARKSFSGTGLKISRLRLRKSKSKEKGLDEIGLNVLDNMDKINKDSADHENMEEDYVRVPKKEYENIEKRVAELESRMSLELQSVSLDDDGNPISAAPTNRNEKRVSIESVQEEYEKTLDKVGELNKNEENVDHLAAQFKRDLRIRKTGENRIMRSPSARKIGSIRKRSKDRNSAILKPLTRHQSLNIHDKPASYKFDRNRSIRRGKPNSIQNGLKSTSNSPRYVNKTVGPARHNSINKGARTSRQNIPRRAETFHYGNKKQLQQHISTPKQPEWVCAASYLSKVAPHLVNETRRASIAKIKEQNAGNVMSKAKLFDHIAADDQENNETGQNEKKIKRFESKRVAPNNNYIKTSTVAHLRKSLTNSDKENVIKKPQLSETLDNIIYDTCKIRTPDRMPMIKTPLTGNRTISIKQSRTMKDSRICTPLPARSLNSHLTPRRSPRLLENKLKPLIVP